MYHSVDFWYPFCLKDQASKKSEHTRWHSAATPCSDKLLCVYWRIVVLIFVWVCNRILLLQQVAQFHFWFDFVWLQNSSVSTLAAICCWTVSPSLYTWGDLLLHYCLHSNIIMYFATQFTVIILAITVVILATIVVNR